jgi:hypothetical protein
MRSLVTSVLLILLPAPTHGGDKPVYPEYQCNIPEGMPKTITLHGKDEVIEERDKHAIYREYHADGWHQMMRHYMKRGNTNFKARIPQEFGIMTRAREIGVAEAKAAVLKLELTISDREGIQKMQKMLREYYRKADSEQAAPSDGDKPPN